MLIDRPYNERWDMLAGMCKSQLLARRIITDNILKVEVFLDSALKAGHEGLMGKALDSHYTPGCSRQEMV